MIKIGEARLRVWIYRELMGTLGNKKRELLQKALDLKQNKGELDPIERRIWSAMQLYKNRREQRGFLKKELKLWEKRTAP